MTRSLRSLLFGLSAAALLVAAPASAAERTFFALLNGGQVVPPSTSQAFGIAYLTYDTALKRLCFSITYSKLEGPETEAHLHGGKPGTVDVVFFDLPLNSPKKSCIGPFGKKEEKALYTGQTYINIHSEAWVAGEVRGQVLPMRLGK